MVFKSLIHAIKNCHAASSVWVCIGVSQVHDEFFGMNYKRWIALDLFKQSWVGMVHFGVAAWNIWNQDSQQLGL